MHTILSKIAVGLASAILTVGSLLGFSNPTPPENLGASIPVSVAVFQTSLQASISATDTAMTLVNGTNKAGNALSGFTCFNIDEGTASEEFVCGTAAGTAISSMTRGIDPVDGDLAVVALKKIHRRGASVKITNFPALAIVSRILNGDETIPNAISYAGAVTCASSAQLCPKSYVDGVAIAGAPDASTTGKGIVEEATMAEINAGTAAGGTSARLFINPSTLLTSNYGTFLPTTGQKDALVGTSGTPSTSNPYATKATTDLKVSQSGAEIYATDSVGTDSYAVTLSPVPSAYATGMTVRFKAGTSNTGAATLNVNALGAKTIVKQYNQTLNNNDIKAGQIVTVIYDTTGDNFQLQSHTANNPASVYSQRLATYTSNTTHLLSNATSETDGSAIYAIEASTVGANAYITRYARDNISGAYYKTHTVSATVTTTIPNPLALAVLGSNLYAVWKDNGVIYMKRYAKADLTGETGMTFSGTEPSTPQAMYSDGTDLYIFSTGTTWYRYTVSGTTATNAQTITGMADPKAAVYDPSTNLVYLFNGSAGAVVVYSYTKTGTLTTTGTTYDFANLDVSDTNHGFGIAIASNSSLFYFYAANIESNSAIDARIIGIIPIGKP